MNAFAIEHIVIRLFGNLKHKDILSCKLVCKSWDMILANPKYWLKKLKALGQPADISQKWMDLLVKANLLQMSNRQIVKALEVSYFQITEYRLGYNEDDEYFNEFVSQLHISWSPIMAAAKSGLMDLIKLLAEMNEDLDKKHPMVCKSCGPQKEYAGYERPLIFALENRHFEMADFLFVKTNALEKDREVGFRLRYNTMKPFNCDSSSHRSKSLFDAAVEFGHLNIVKTMLGNTHNFQRANQHWYELLWFTIKSNQNEVLEFVSHLGNFVRNQIWSLTKYAMSNGNAGAVKILVRFADYNYLQYINNWSSGFDEKYRRIIHEEILKRHQLSSMFG